MTRGICSPASALCAVRRVHHHGQPTARAAASVLLRLPHELERGATVCRNDLISPLERMDDAVLTALAGNTLRPAVVSAIISGVLEQLIPQNVESRVDDLRQQLRVVETKMANLSAAVEQGAANLPSIIALLTARQQERETLIADISAAETLSQIDADRDPIEAKVQGIVAEWRTLLTGSVADGRQLLREVLEGPLRLPPRARAIGSAGPWPPGVSLRGRSCLCQECPQRESNPRRRRERAVS
jgi:hypothetical protein